MPGLGGGTLLIYADGASRGNPGPAAAGAVIKDEDGTKIAEISRYLGDATNNQAEYEALIAALETALRFNPRAINVFIDSELVVKQLDGRYQIKNPGLRPLADKARLLLARVGVFKVAHIPGERNSEAHALAAAALRKKTQA